MLVIPVGHVARHMHITAASSTRKRGWWQAVIHSSTTPRIAQSCKQPCTSWHLHTTCTSTTDITRSAQKVSDTSTCNTLVLMATNNHQLEPAAGWGQQNAAKRCCCTYSKRTGLTDPCCTKSQPRSFAADTQLAAADRLPHQSHNIPCSCKCFCQLLHYKLSSI